MPIPPPVLQCYKYVDTHRQQYIEELRKITAIPNVSSDINARGHISSLIKWMASRLKNLGFKIELRDIGKYTPDGEKAEIKIPTVILGTLGKRSNKKTLLYYCHLDVLKVGDLSKWQTDPFVLTERNGKLFGRGAAKMKGPIMCFLHAIECYQVLGIEIPINIKIICESMNECKSVGLPRLLEMLKTSFLVDIDSILMTDSQWVGRQYPCILYGFRGVCYFNVTIDGFCHDLHSGEYGGVVYEPMQDMVFIINSLVDLSGRIKVPGFYDDVNQVTPDEEELYRKLKIDMEEYRQDAGVTKLSHNEDVVETLMHVWRYPSFNLHFINAFSSCGCATKLSIPRKVVARFSIRIVPRQKPETVCEMIFNHVNKMLKQRCSPNDIKMDAKNLSRPWYENTRHWNYQAARIATKQVYKEEANLVREGNGYPILLELHKALPDKNILLLPLVNSEANIHSECENISLRCYFESTKLLANYFYHLDICSRKESESKDTRRNVCSGLN